jgi:hypothetical protein
MMSRPIERRSSRQCLVFSTGTWAGFDSRNAVEAF